MTDDTPTTTGSLFENLESRGRFLRKLGLIAAGGAAALLFPAVARANTSCCRDDTCGISCTGGKLPYKCSDSCSGTRCCACFTPTSNCIVQPCGVC